MLGARRSPQKLAAASEGFSGDRFGCMDHGLMFPGLGSLSILFNYRFFKNRIRFNLGFWRFSGKKDPWKRMDGEGTPKKIFGEFLHGLKRDPFKLVLAYVRSVCVHSPSLWGSLRLWNWRLTAPRL